MNLISATNFLAQGCSRTLFLKVAAKAEKTTGQKPTVSQAIAQTAQGYITCSAINNALKALDQVALPTAFGWTVLLIPPLVSLVEHKLAPGISKKALGMLREYLGPVFRTAFAVSQLALIYFTGSFAAAAAIGFLALDALERNGWLFERIGKVYGSIQKPLFLLNGLFQATTWRSGIINTAVRLTAIVAMQFFLSKIPEPGVPLASKEALLPDPQRNTGQLSSQILREIMQEDDPCNRFKPNFQHLFWKGHSPTPDVELNELLTQWDMLANKAEFSQKMTAGLRVVLNTRLSNWKKIHPDGICLQQYHYLRVIVNHLKSSECTDKQRVEVLMNLAKSSPPELEKAFALSSERDGTIPLRKAIVQNLQIYRTIQYRNSMRHHGAVPDWMITGYFYFFQMPYPPPPSTFKALRIEPEPGMYGSSAVGPLGILPRPQDLATLEFFRQSWSDEDIRNTLKKLDYDVENMVDNTCFSFSGKMTNWWQTFMKGKPLEQIGKIRALFTTRKSRLTPRSSQALDIAEISGVRAKNQAKYRYEDQEYTAKLRRKAVTPEAVLDAQPNFDTERAVLAMLFEMGIIQEKSPPSQRPAPSAQPRAAAQSSALHPSLARLGEPLPLPQRP